MQILYNSLFFTHKQLPCVKFYFVQPNSTFQVYNASAGSGKTFTLVKEYLKILLQSEDIFRFQKVLAITFTNKAATEMKERVLKNLHHFSEGTTTDLTKIISQETSLDKKTIKERSKKVLTAILQNYSAFSITTIDSFTHKIIRSFAYDLGLSLNFEVEMDALSLLNEAVDMLISKIGTDKPLTKLLIDFSLSKIDEDKSWDISRELNDFAKILLNEDDTKHFRKLRHKTLSDFVNLKKEVTTQKTELEQKLKKTGKEALTIIANAGLTPEDFIRKTLPNFFQDVSEWKTNFKFETRSETIEKAFINHNFCKKNTSAETVSSIDSITPQLWDLFSQLKQYYGQLVLGQLMIKSIIPLAVLHHINSELTTIKEENNIRLNAEFNQLISDNIKDQPAPFIYERIGQRFMHYFIDEMQDTSELQWLNLIPLITNSLAQENSSLLLVGDGKQAIYRWRGGKAEQFINLSSDKKNPFQIKKQLKNLTTNYRSYSEIVNFNNLFFQHTANFLQNDDYKTLFIEGNKQKTTTKNGGFVSLSFLEKELDNEENKLKYPKKVLEKINKLKKDKFSLGEICVLVRRKKDGIAIANYLSEEGVKIVSSETLLLQNSSKVIFLVNILQLIEHPKDEETRFDVLYFLYHHLNITEAKHTFLQQFTKQPIELVFETLKKYGTNFKWQKIHQLPFYEKVETIIQGFYLINNSDAYVQFFLDVVLEQQRKNNSTQDFLDYWNEKKDSLSIVAPKSDDAVQIMTIHKSKGLEFPVVIFPCDLDIYRQINPKVWLDDLGENTKAFDELLVDFSVKLNYVNEKGASIYQHQREELELDNLNLLYVALTRPVEQLHIITEYNISAKGNENTNYYSGIFINFLKQQNLWDSEQLDYSFGQPTRISVPKKDNLLMEIQEDFISSSWQLHTVKIVANSSKLWDTEQGKAINFGNLIHEMLSKIIIASDVEKVIQQYEKQGVFLSEEKEMIAQYIYRVVNHQKLQAYFTEDVTAYNEREITTEDNHIIIPDRLIFNGNNVTIIDYKTGKPHKKYHQQILKYANVLQAMNFTVTKKLLIYINDNVLIEEVA